MGHEISTCQMQHDAAANNRINKIEASYTLEGTVLENVDYKSHFLWIHMRGPSFYP